MPTSTPSDFPLDGPQPVPSVPVARHELARDPGPRVFHRTKSPVPDVRDPRGLVHQLEDERRVVLAKPAELQPIGFKDSHGTLMIDGE